MRSDELYAYQGPQGEEAVQAAIQACQDQGYAPGSTIIHEHMGRFEFVAWNETPTGFYNGARYPMILRRVSDGKVFEYGQEGFSVTD